MIEVITTMVSISIQSTINGSIINEEHMQRRGMKVSGQDFFLGYERIDGKIGIRNRLLVIAPIDCSIELARKIAHKVVDSVAVTQTYGCREDSMLINQFVGSAKNPNIAGVLIVGLGCETLTGELLKEKIEDSGKPVHNITIQDEGGTVNTYEKGVNILKK